MKENMVVGSITQLGPLGFPAITKELADSVRSYNSRDPVAEIIIALAKHNIPISAMDQVFEAVKIEACNATIVSAIVAREILAERKAP
ncbi:MAG: hypothetical protein AB9917_13835 [Negativicutes bacterium]